MVHVLKLKEGYNQIVERHPLYFADLPLDEALPFIKKVKNVVNKVMGRSSDH
jgi:hypothetical protein